MTIYLSPLVLALLIAALILIPWVGFWLYTRRQRLDETLFGREMIIDSMQDGVIVIDRANRIVEINAAARELLGLDNAPRVGQILDDIVQNTPLEDSLRQKVYNNHEITFLHKQAERVWDVRDVPIQHRLGEKIGRSLLIRDITDRRQAERERNRHALIFDNILDSVILTDLNGLIIDCNPATEQLFGYTRAEIINQPPRIWHHPQKAEHLNAHILAELRKQGRWSGELPFVRKDGREGYAEIVVFRLLDENDQWIASVGVSRDITKRHEVEQSLRAQNQLFEQLVAVARATAEGPALRETLQNSLDAAVSLTGAKNGTIFLLDEENRVTDRIIVRDEVTDPKADRIVEQVMTKGLAGWVVEHEETAVIADTHEDARWLRNPDDPYEARSVMAVPIFSTSTLLGVITLMHPQPDFFQPNHMILMEGASVQMMLALRNAQIFEKQRLLAEENARLYAQALEALVLAEQANHTKSQFLANMSHELRTPLNAIIGYAEMLQEDVQEQGNPIMQKDLEHIQIAGNHLLEIVNDVLDLSKIEAGKIDLYIDSFLLQDLVDDVVSALQPGLRRQNNKLVLETHTMPTEMVADVLRVRQILLNVLGNAVKFTDSGTITFRIFSTQFDDKSGVCFEVEDTGIGINPDHFEIIFQPFSQVDASATRRFGGTGLGLVITDRFCKMMGGRIEVKSELGVGSCFTIYLPAMVERVSR